MVKKSALNVDLAKVYSDPSGKKSSLITVMAWGDAVDVVDVTSSHIQINAVKFEKQNDGSILPVKTDGYIVPPKSAKKADGSKLKTEDIVIPLKSNRVLKVNFVDVQQGDGAVIESPDGKVILVDGGDNQLFARYLAARFRNTTLEKPKEIECILVTHGDADHFAGLSKILESESHAEPRKRLFVEPKRVYHNGLVKRPSKDASKKAVPDKELLGPTKVVDGKTILVGLVDDLLSVPDAEMNEPFKAWKETLATWNKRSKLELRSLSFGEDDAFDFFKGDDLEIAVLGPFLTDAGGVQGLKFLGNPPKGPRIGHDSLSLGEDEFKGFSASHTINGHSVVFQLRYGGFSYLFTGDLNDESSRILARKHQKNEINIRSDVFKVPHHGSADFSGAFVKMVSPIASVISSGDESARKEYIHPRSTLVGALGKHSRVDEPLIFVTELVAFFNVEGKSRVTDPKKDKTRGEFFGFSRTAYGIVKTRTDGNRLLIYTDSGKADMKEAYAYSLDKDGSPSPSVVISV